MSELLSIVGIIFGALVLLPVLSYLVIKFGAAAYFHERQKQQQTKNQNESINQRTTDREEA